jgi:hypothetical protein
MMEPAGKRSIDPPSRGMDGFSCIRKMHRLLAGFGSGGEDVRDGERHDR